MGLRRNRLAWGRTLCVLAVLNGVFDSAVAGDPIAAPDNGTLWRTVSNQALEAMRGGFDMGGGLLVNFGITRAVYVNGALLTETTLNVGDVSRLTSAQAARLHSQLTEVNLVQNGPGNSAPANLSSLGNGLIIQNTLNNQHLSAQTTINASSNGLSMIRNLNTQGVIDEAINRAVGPR